MFEEEAPRFRSIVRKCGMLIVGYARHGVRIRMEKKGQQNHAIYRGTDFLLLGSALRS